MRSVLFLALGAVVWAPACVLDRTGQSASEIYRRELALQGARVGSLEQQFDNVDARVGQLEELTRARGQDEIMRMETLDQLRTEVARIRGEVELLRHQADQSASGTVAQVEDHTFRLLWLESRADQVEKALGVKTPAPPVRAPTEGAEGETDEGPGGEGPPVDGVEGDGAVVVDGAEGDGSEPEAAGPDGLMELAADHLAGGREKAAEAVLKRFLSEHPENARVAEARYRLAEASFNAKRYPHAVLKFQEVIDRHRDSPWASWAMLRQGECFEVQGQADNAKLFYEDVVRLWPKSKAAKEARTKL